jgi:hypothetical protein
LFLPNVWSVSQADSNKISYNILGSWSAVLFNTSGSVKTTW